jgi:hypothetical protein
VGSNPTLATKPPDGDGESSPHHFGIGETMEFGGEIVLVVMLFAAVSVLTLVLLSTPIRFPPRKHFRDTVIDFALVFAAFFAYGGSCILLISSIFNNWGR